MLIRNFVHWLIWIRNGNLQIGGPVKPLVTITCRNCGNTQLVNLLVLSRETQNIQQEGEKDNG